MGVVRREAQRRWASALGGIAALCSLPALIGALPASADGGDPAALRDRILAANTPYSGFAESQGSLGLPDLPGLGDVAELLGSRTQLRTWHASDDVWRVDVIGPNGETGMYAVDDEIDDVVLYGDDPYAGVLTWDYERNSVVRLLGEPPVRLPRAQDLVPAELGRRLLAGLRGQERLESLPAQRVAGVDAAGLRLVPADPDTSIGHVDVWADPETGLPLEVRVTGRDGGAPGLTTRFLDLEQGAGAVPAEAVEPKSPTSAAHVLAAAPQISDFIDRNAFGELPARLAGRERSRLVGDTGRAVRTYGQGFSTFAVVSLPGRLGQRSYDAADQADAEEVPLVCGTAMLLRTPLLTLVVVMPDWASAFLLAGSVSGDLLTRAAQELTSAVSDGCAG